MTKLLDGRSSVRIPIGVGDLFYLQNVQTDAWDNLAFHSMGTARYLRGMGQESNRGVMLTTHFHAVPKPRINGALPPPLYVFIECIGTVYFYLINYRVETCLLVRLICLFQVNS
jgi:hypothetical protein